MAARNFSTWVPIEVSDFVNGREVQDSAVQSVGIERPMQANQVDEPRYLNANVDGGSALVEDTNDGDTIPMFAYQYNGKATIDQAQSEDSVANEVEAWSAEWLNSLHIAYDNASIGVSATRSGTATAYRPYTSIYKAVRTSDTGAGYTADTNYAATGTGGLTYSNMNAALGVVEATKFWTPQSGVVLFDPTVMKSIRGILDLQGRPIFVESTAGMPGGGTRPVYTIFGVPAYPTFGARVSDTFKMAITGKPLMVFVNRRYLRKSNRIAPQTNFIDAKINTNALEHTVQARGRLGFALTVPQAASVLEIG